ncbi:hypothetical protein NKJ72_19945 [Mesorhizobium sp. M0045]|uniref:hypothetical protein n=1 Tax=Mesorhizobium sp. M0045 TaxID=2956857 RepID=UPI00333BA78E
MKSRKLWCIAVLVPSFLASEAQGTDYLFHVSCQNTNLVVEWKTGDINPGRELLRVSTSTKYPNCTVSDYNQARDRNLPRETYEHVAGVIAGITLIGTIICHFFGCG